MITVEHNYIKVLSVCKNDNSLDFSINDHIGSVIYDLSTNYKDEIIIWYDSKEKDNINFQYIKSAFLSDRLFLSYNPGGNFFTDQIDYVEDSPFINVPKNVRFATWQMSSLVGCLNCAVISQSRRQIWSHNSFDFCLNSFAKIYQPLGLFCYSDPKLLKTNNITELVSVANISQLFEFVKKHYKTRWIFLLAINLMIYERKFPILALLSSLFIKKSSEAEGISFLRGEKHVAFSKVDIDVVIPTIGRAKYLYDVLEDFAAQTYLPSKIIIIEQNTSEDNKTDLDFITNRQWPFKVIHIFTLNLGVCQARNLGLSEITGDWTFFADDDIRICRNFLSEALSSLLFLEVEAATYRCEMNHNISKDNYISQTTMFGGGCSIVKSNRLSGIRFNESYEFGFGEDLDFGMQIRKSGTDIIYFPSPMIIHLKAPIGGFRTQFKLPWANDSVLPKPSPAVMLFRLLHNSPKQIFAYKTILFIKNYKTQSIKNPHSYFKVFQQRWEASKRWATKINT